MNENLNLAEILKDCPSGTKLYSPVYGDVELEKVIQETRRFDDETGETFKMRDKADAVDYKYFTEPNILPIHISDEFIKQSTILEQLEKYHLTPEQIIDDIKKI